MTQILILEDSAERIFSFVKKFYAQDSNASITVTANASTAIELLKNTKFSYVFLDHDLGGKQMEWDENNCGMLVAKYIADNPLTDYTKVVVHSFNAERAKVMVSMIPGALYVPGIWL